MPVRYSVTNAWLRELDKNCRFSLVRMAGTTLKLSIISAVRPPSTKSASNQLYQNIMATNRSMNGRSSNRATAAPLTNSRIVSTPCRRASTVPAGRKSKYRTGSASRCSNTRAPSTASTRLPVCSTRYCRIHDIPAEKSISANSAIATMYSVLKVW